MDDPEISAEEAISGVGSIFPMSRVKKIMKADKDIHMCSAEAVLLTSLAAVLADRRSIKS